MNIVFYTGKEGFRKILKKYQEIALRVLWETESPLTTRDVWIEVNKRLEESRSISRTSIITFLNAMCEEGVLNYEEETAKGGYRRRYSTSFDEEGFKRQVAKTVTSKLSTIWPDATREAFLRYIEKARHHHNEKIRLRNLEKLKETVKGIKEYQLKQLKEYLELLRLAYDLEYREHMANP